MAKLASRGRGKRVRFQGGTMFPVVLTAVFVVMLGAVVYARQSMPSEGSGPPTLSQKWVASYGIRVCNEDGTAKGLPNLIGDKTTPTEIDSATGQEVPANKAYRDTGVNSAGDGVIHYFPNSSKSTGTRAKLGVFLNVYGVKISGSKLELPEDQVGEGEQRVWDTKKMKCGGKEPSIRVRVWDDYTGSRYTDYVTDFNNIRIRNNGMAFSIAFLPNETTDIPKPPSAADLLSIVGSSGADPIDGSATSADSTPADSTPTDSTPAVSSPADSTPADSTAAPTTTTG